MIAQTGIANFLLLAKDCIVLDVRSPAEYGHAHVPGAYSLPLFSDEERKIAGTAYKQQGREQAIKIGLDYFGVKMRLMVEEVEQIIKQHEAEKNNSDKTVLVHCWRGGMRSAGVAWLLDLYGFKVHVLQGGYKSYRNWVLRQFDQPWFLKIIGGYTGSGKTEVLKELVAQGHNTIDLEGIARHKGSAFGALGEEPQPTQEQFENELAAAFHQVNINDAIWLEDESRRIGPVNIPSALYNSMQSAELYIMDIPFEQRLEYIVREYGRYSKEELVAAIARIQKRLGGLNAKNAGNYLQEDNYKEGFRILLQYYDKCYDKGLKERKSAHGVYTVSCEDVDAIKNSGLLAQIKTN